MKIGAMQGILKATSESEAIQRAADWGFDAIELITKSGPGGEPLLWSDQETQGIEDALKKTGVRLSSTCLGSFNSCGLVDPGPVGMKKIRQSLKDNIRSARELGAGAILVPFFGKNGINDANDEDRLVEGVLDAVPVAEEHDVVLALELTSSASSMLAILRRVGSPFVKLYYDVGNIKGKGFDNAPALRELGEAVAAVHIKDCVAGGGSVPLGEGDVDFEAVRDALKDIGYHRPLMLETPSGQNPEADAKRNLAFVKRVWNL